ncbi:hypothetical protein G7Y89_g6322 [Cudoniella acicularis]|uniref:Heterokaryon incompatibility domain-containing protein n=1 Tax=Cudoniella acicularis TaxID=354080 RepID=A0A8H4W2Z5_9HELO|nr:hypothetical protein G7Y89_g6322 [Cudoniella acicularis]
MPPTLKELPLKEPTEGEILVKILVTGVCHSGSFGNPFPIVPGHELIGNICAIPPSEKRRKIGDRVGGPWHGGHDSICKQCQRGQFQMCRNEAINGVTKDGGYAESKNKTSLYNREGENWWSLSRTFGGPSPTRKLITNGEGSGDPQAFDIGTNLNEALRKFRDEEDIRKCCLWIDAICINQTDNDEKPWQFASMKSIYEQAAEVLAWLGPSIDTDKKAFDMLVDLENRLGETGPDLAAE